ncbi:MAG: hypothetical protein ACLQU3_27340, partial [Limisphaerales bacterium]
SKAVWAREDARPPGKEARPTGPGGGSSSPYAAGAGTRARTTFGTSIQPSICWYVRIQTAVPAFGTPYRAT